MAIEIPALSYPSAEFEVSEDTPVLLRHKLDEYARWKFADGTFSDKFHSAPEGMFYFMRGVIEGKTSVNQVDRAMDLLEKSRLPGLTEILSKIFLIIPLEKPKTGFGSNRGPSDPSMN